MSRKDWNLKLFSKKNLFDLSNIYKNAIIYQNIYQLCAQNREIGLYLR
jgi:hypothetical protein